MNNCKIMGNLVHKNQIGGNGYFARSYGGGIYANGQTELNNCIVDSNTAESITNGTFGSSSTSRGGGLYFNAKFEMTNCIISNNICSATTSVSQREEGSGIFNNCQDTANVVNCTIAYNQQGGIYSDGTTNSTAEIINSIFYFNLDTADQIVGTNLVSYSNIQQGYAGIGNIDVNPIFFSLTDLRIVPPSNCIDAGDPAGQYNDGCLPPSLGLVRNDMGAYGGSGGCNWINMPPCPSFVTSIFETENSAYTEELIVSPNPFTSNLTIEWDHGLNIDQLIFSDLLGRELNRISVFKKEKLFWNSGDLPKGVYVIKALGDVVKSIKIIKQ